MSGSFSNFTVRLDSATVSDVVVFLQADDSGATFIRCTVPAGTRTCTSGAAVAFAPAGSNLYIGANAGPASLSFGYTFQAGPRPL